MTRSPSDGAATGASKLIVSSSEIDRTLTAQLAVAWAGENGEEPRLGWWRSDLASPYGGMDLFRHLLPSTVEWAVLQGAREAARRTDGDVRRRDHDPDRIVSLFSLGFELDERIDERLQDLKRSGVRPTKALPELGEILTPTWNRARFLDWISSHGKPEVTAAPVGRRIKANFATSLDENVHQLIGALAPLFDEYPLPHFRKTR
jgi:hypothetical protein